MDTGIYRGDRVRVVADKRGKRIHPYIGYVSAILSNGYEITRRTTSTLYVRADQVVKVADGNGHLPHENLPLAKPGHMCYTTDDAEWRDRDDNDEI